MISFGSIARGSCGLGGESLTPLEIGCLIGRLTIGKLDLGRLFWLREHLALLVEYGLAASIGVRGVRGPAVHLFWIVESEKSSFVSVKVIKDASPCGGLTSISMANLQLFEI